MNCQGSTAFHCPFFSLTAADLSALEEAGLFSCSLFYVHERSDQKGLTFPKVTHTHTKKKLNKAGKFLRSRNPTKPHEARISCGLLKVVSGRHTVPLQNSTSAPAAPGLLGHRGRGRREAVLFRPPARCSKLVPLIGLISCLT